MKPVSIVISYSRKDEKFAEALHSHLMPLEREGQIDSWYDRHIAAGSIWSDELSNKLRTANIIILLVSADYYVSDFCIKKELPIAQQRFEDGEAIVLPIIVRPVNWEGTPISKWQVLPKDGQPVVQWDNVDAAWLQVVAAVKLAVLRLSHFDSDEIDEKSLRSLSKGRPEQQIESFLRHRSSNSAKINKALDDAQALWGKEPRDMLAIAEKLGDAQEMKIKNLTAELQLLQKIDATKESAQVQSELSRKCTSLTREIGDAMVDYKKMMNAVSAQMRVEQDLFMIPVRRIR